MPQNPSLPSLAKSCNCKKICNCATVPSYFYDGTVATCIHFYIVFFPGDGGWVFLIIFLWRERERVGEINILINRWDKWEMRCCVYYKMV